MKQPIELPPPPDPDPAGDPIAQALVAEVNEHGEGASAAGVIARAGVTEAGFKARYASLDDCALDVFERHIDVFKRRIGGAFNIDADWRDSLRNAAYESADWIDDSRPVVSFGMTGVLQLKNEIARVRREGAFVWCAQMIDLGRTEPGSLAADDASTATFAVGSILQLLTYRLQAGIPFDTHKVVPEMMYSVVRAYLGDEAADEELTLPRPSRT